MVQAAFTDATNSSTPTKGTPSHLLTAAKLLRNAEVDSRLPLGADNDIIVPTITLDGAADGVRPGGTAAHAFHFTGRHEHRVIENVGHNLPQEAPETFAEAVLTARSWHTMDGPRTTRLRSPE
jgi:pimeloyl-ACP methyl ester carboxylesterase